MNTAHEKTDATESGSQGHQGTSQPKQIVTLQPLLLQGTGALMPADDDPVTEVTLQAFELASRSHIHRILIRAGESLLPSLSSTGKHIPPFPAGSRLLAATLLVHVKGQAEPCTVELSIARGITLDCLQCASLIRQFLEKRHILSTVAYGLLLLACLALDDPQPSTPSSQPEPNDCPVCEQDTVPSGDTPPTPPPQEADPMPFLVFDEFALLQLSTLNPQPSLQ